MHEIRIAEELTKIILQAAKDGNLATVSKVNISFGSLIQIVPDIFEGAFREYVKGTMAENAELAVEVLAVRVECKLCGLESVLREMDFRCTGCGSEELEIIQGKELFVKSIEGE
jgi:hydrogenase nickel incorporation protein HypA/HybF